MMRYILCQTNRCWVSKVWEAWQEVRRLFQESRKVQRPEQQRQWYREGMGPIRIEMVSSEMFEYGNMVEKRVKMCLRF